MNLCYLIADQIHRYRMRCNPNVETRVTTSDDYWKWQYTSSEKYFAKFFDLNDHLEGADVIDVGCGLGGRTCFLGSRNVRSIVGIDTNHDEIVQASRLLSEHGQPDIQSRVSFEKVDESDPPRYQNRFDVALLVDSLEHVRDPTAILNITESMLKPGGICYFSTLGWYYHQASHVSSIIPIPFSTLFFSDRQILDAVRRIVDQPYYQPTIWDSDPPSQRWKDVESLHDRPGEYLNKYTIARFRKSMEASAFAQWQLHVEGFSTDRFPWLAPFNFLTRIPFIEEVYHSAIFGKLVKANAIGLEQDEVPQDREVRRSA